MHHRLGFASRLLVCLALCAIAPATPAATKALRIMVYGGGGQIGSAIAKEAIGRGHHVTVVVRNPASVKFHAPGLAMIKGDALDSDDVVRRAAGEDVLICAVSGSNGAEGEHFYRRVATSLVTALRKLGAPAPRLLVVGGAASLKDDKGRLVLESLPAAFQNGEPSAQMEALEYYRTVSDVSWSYFSPARSIVPGTRTGKFRLGTDTLLSDAAGNSQISIEDYAVAMIDEAESARHRHQRFTIGY